MRIWHSSSAKQFSNIVWDHQLLLLAIHRTQEWLYLDKLQFQLNHRQYHLLISLKNPIPLKDLLYFTIQKLIKVNQDVFCNGLYPLQTKYFMRVVSYLLSGHELKFHYGKVLYPLQADDFHMRFNHINIHPSYR